MNREVILLSRPKGLPDASLFAIRESEVPHIREGEVLIRTHYLTVDPYMRGRMNDRPSYIAPFQLNQPLSGGVVGKVTESKNPRFRVGDIVTGMLNWADYNVSDGKGIQKVDPDLAPISTALGVLGMPGLTAYFGFLDIGAPKAGETVVISGAAGAVGTLVGQIAKIKGCRVVGIAGSDDKVDYLVRELKFDAALNYKKPEFAAELKKACPQGVDIYFDNVGGDISDQVIHLINKQARIVLCGQISMYNLDKPDQGPRNTWLLLTRSALMKGFIIFDYHERYPEGIKQLAEWLKEGKIRYKETVAEGLESAPHAFIGLFKGENIGKQLVKVS